MTKQQKPPEKLVMPSQPVFDGEDDAVYIFEKIMHRQRYGVTDREILTAKIAEHAEEIENRALLTLRAQRSQAKRAVNPKKVGSTVNAR